MNFSLLHKHDFQLWNAVQTKSLTSIPVQKYEVWKAFLSFKLRFVLWKYTRFHFEASIYDRYFREYFPGKQFSESQPVQIFSSNFIGQTGDRRWSVCADFFQKLLPLPYWNSGRSKTMLSVLVAKRRLDDVRELEFRKYSVTVWEQSVIKNLSMSDTNTCNLRRAVVLLPGVVFPSDCEHSGDGFSVCD